MTEKHYPSMEKLGCCKPGQLCEYHLTKVNPENIIGYVGLEETSRGSANPPLEVWGKEYINKIDETTSVVKNKKEYKDLNTINKISSILDKVNSFWGEENNSDALNGKLHEKWEKWAEDVKEKNKYGAGGWKSSPQQLSQLIEVLKVLREENIKLEDYLRIGTASGKHTQQEIFAMSVASKGGDKKPELDIVDSCEAPLLESKFLAKTAVKETLVGSALEFPEEMSGKYSIATTHFIESFLPDKKTFENSSMSHEEALHLKEKFFDNVYRVLKNEGFFITALGVETGSPRRLNNLSELEKCLAEAGFKKENIVIVPTTDPYDYDNKNQTLLEGNYFVVAQKS